MRRQRLPACTGQTDIVMTQRSAERLQNSRDLFLRHLSSSCVFATSSSLSAVGGVATSDSPTIPTATQRRKRTDSPPTSSSSSSSPPPLSSSFSPTPFVFTTGVRNCRSRLLKLLSSDHFRVKPAKTTWCKKSAAVPIDVSTQVRKLSCWCLVLLLLVLSLLTQPATGKPHFQKLPDKIIVTSRFCRPVPQEVLRARMGSAFDPSRMALDMETAKRTFGSDNLRRSDSHYYQGDDPNASVVSEREMDEEEIVVREEEQEVFSDGRVYDEIAEQDSRYESENDVVDDDEGDDDDDDGAEEDEYSDDLSDNGDDDDDDDDDGGTDTNKNAFVGRQTSSRERAIPRRSRGRSGTLRKRTEWEAESTNKESVDSFDYMRKRRRRRRRSLGGNSNSRRSRLRNRSSSRGSDNSRKNNSSDNRNAKSKKSRNDNFRHLRLLLSGGRKNGRKLRKQLKKEFRNSANSMKPPPWQCEMKTSVMAMKNAFPPYIINGKCSTDKCFYRLYNCEPVKYIIKVFQKDPNKCIPLPLEGNSTVFEESWAITKQHVTVGCNCARFIQNPKSKGRRKH